MTDTKTDAAPRQQSPQEKKDLDKELNKALEDSFPSSDPISITQPTPTKKDAETKK